MSLGASYLRWPLCCRRTGEIPWAPWGRPFPRERHAIAQGSGAGGRSIRREMGLPWGEPLRGEEGAALLRPRFWVWGLWRGGG